MNAAPIWGMTREQIEVRQYDGGAVINWPCKDGCPAYAMIPGDHSGFIRFLMCMAWPMLPMGSVSWRALEAPCGHLT